jgi:hypothetical protein
LTPVHVDHHDHVASRGVRWVSGRWRRLQDGWCVKLVDEDTRWYLSASRDKLRQDVCCNVVVADDVVELETLQCFPPIATNPLGNTTISVGIGGYYCTETVIWLQFVCLLQHKI